MGLEYYASRSPVVSMFSSHTHYFDNGPVYSPVADSNTSQLRKLATKFPNPPSTHLSQTFNGNVGRKRSRCDLGDDDEPDSSGPVQAPKSRASPILGPGMTLIYPDEPPLNIAAESQSGTWLEQETNAEVVAASAAASLVDRPRLPARKSSRRISVDESLESTIPSQLDPIVLRLGIGWQRFDHEQAPSVAGEETYIKNQYPYITSPKIVLHHEGLAIYVVRSAAIDLRGLLNQWWLMTEDLRSCKLLCNSNEDDVLRRLANKKQDDRGNWIPDILADGQIIHAKDFIRPLTPQPVDVFDSMEVDA